MHARTRLAVGLVYETFDSYAPRPGAPLDEDVEYEPLSTIEALEAAIRALGAEPVRLGSPPALLEAIGRGGLPRLDAALSIAEGYGSRNRESWAPVLLEMAGVPALGSDGASLSLTLDKAWANRAAAAAGLPVAPHCVLDSARSVRDAVLPAAFPLFVKPRWEGTAKGIRQSSRVENRASLAREVERIVRDYRQPAFVELFVPGAEFTVAVVGHDPPRALPVLQRPLETRSGIGLHVLEGHGRDSGPQAFDYHLPGQITSALEEELQELALRAFHLFECRDFARVDLRLDAAGAPVFLEINPLPTFAPDGTFGILAELEGRGYVAFLADLIGEALLRLGLRTCGAEAT